MQLTELSNDELAMRWADIKRGEEIANKQRVEVEAEIIARLGNKEEGSETHTLDSGIKIEITGKMTYKADDLEATVRACDALPPELRPIKTETKVDETGAKWLRANRPDLWQLISHTITTKPAKTAVKVKF